MRGAAATWRANLLPKLSMSSPLISEPRGVADECILAKNEKSVRVNTYR